MMAADDPRHGSNAGYNDGCRKTCCRRAKKIDRHRRLAMIANGHEFTIPRDRTVRKLRALSALGWSTDAIGAEMGVSGAAVRDFLKRDKEEVWASVAARYDRAYRRLEMRRPPTTTGAKKLRTMAANRGYLPPLAWEDIDAGILADQRGSRDPQRFDEGEIEHVMQYHDFEVWLSPLEKSEIVRRWTASGRSERSLCALTGWREGRYRTPKPEEAA